MEIEPEINTKLRILLILRSLIYTHCVRGVFRDKSISLNVYKKLSTLREDLQEKKSDNINNKVCDNVCLRKQF